MRRTSRVEWSISVTGLQKSPQHRYLMTLPFLPYERCPFVPAGRNYTEFLAATLEAHGHIEEERIADAFDRLDCDGSGYVSKEDLKEFLGNSATAKEIDDIIKEGDKDKDGKRECMFD
jgi:hypothetical protein